MPLERGAGAIGNYWRAVPRTDCDDLLDLRRGANESDGVGRRSRIPGLILAVLFACRGCRRQPIA
jgi:hypothetical protein